MFHLLVFVRTYTFEFEGTIWMYHDDHKAHILLMIL